MESDKPKSGLRFVKVCGMERVFDPRGDPEGGAKKNPCPDCHFCQFCSDSRCNACRGGRGGDFARSGAGCRKLSMREQILLYEENNLREKKKADESKNDEKEK